MKLNLITKLVVPCLILILVAGLVFGAGCKKAEPQRPPASQALAPAQLASTLVPNVPMDIYVYCKQDSPTRVPIKVDDPNTVMNVESLAVWGVPAPDGFAFGVALTLTSSGDAKKLDSQIAAGPDMWKMLSDKTVYLVQGTGSAAEALKTAISRKDFKSYDDANALAAVARLPGGGQTKLGAVAVVKPSSEFVDFMSQITGGQNMGMVKTVLSFAKLEVVAAGLYSSQQIDGVNMMKAMSGGADMFSLDLGILILAKSSLPGFVVAPTVAEFLKQYHFTETKIGDKTVYKLARSAGGGTVTILIRIEGSSVFAAVSGKESYAQTLIMNVNP